MFRLIQDGRKNIRRLCAIAEVSPKCFYEHRKGPSDKEISDASLIIIIKKVQEEYGNSVGYRKMQDRLHDDYGITIGRQKTLRLMGQAKMLSTVRRKHFSEEYYVRRREMKDCAPPDLIGRDFFALEPFKRFVCDITYLTGCDETWYLSVIEDLFNGEIVGWKIGEHCTAALCMETVIMMKETIGKTEGTILHSDGGSTYISYDYRELLISLGIRQSMGKKLTCYDNARIESFNGVLKTEALYAFFGKTKVKDRRIPVRKLAERALWFIPVYNNLRKKDALGHMTPVAFREANNRGTYPVCLNDLTNLETRNI